MGLQLDTLGVDIDSKSCDYVVLVRLFIENNFCNLIFLFVYISFFLLNFSTNNIWAKGTLIVANKSMLWRSSCKKGFSQKYKRASFHDVLIDDNYAIMFSYALP